MFANFEQGNGHVSGSLELACLRACIVPWLGAAFPRLCQSVFTVCQPLLLMSVVKYVQEEHKTTGHRDGLIVAATFVYGGLAVSFHSQAFFHGKGSRQLTFAFSRSPRQIMIIWHIELQLRFAVCFCHRRQERRSS